jgi:hypothetical protein
VDFPTAEEAKAMLLKAVAAVNADKAKALDMFNKGEGGFLDRDLYVFCLRAGFAYRRHWVWRSDRRFSQRPWLQR